MATLEDRDYLERLRALAPLLSPGAFFLTGEDHLRVISLNNSSVTGLTIVGRMLTLEGRIVPFAERHVMNTDRTAATTNHSLGPGWLLNVSAFAASGTPLIGQTFVRLQIVRGLTGAMQELATLAQGPCNAVQRLAYPGSPIRSSLETPGVIRSVTGTDPAAGVEISETVPTGARWRLLSFSVRLVTSITEANRAVNLRVDDGTTTYFQADPPEVQIASQNFRWQTALGLERLGQTLDTRTWNYPADLRLLAGHRIRTSTTGLQVDDEWAAPQLLVEEWLEGA